MLERANALQRVTERGDTSIDMSIFIRGNEIGDLHAGSDRQKLNILQRFEEASAFMHRSRAAAIARILLSHPRTSMKSYVPSVVINYLIRG